MHRLYDFVEESYQKGEPGHVKVGIVKADIEFLATKYMQLGNKFDEMRIINYINFVEDYENIETQGMSAGVNELSIDNPLQIREITLRNKALWQKKMKDIPFECQTIYEKMSKYLSKKNLEDKLALALVNADVLRQGMLGGTEIRQVLVKCSMPVNHKQVDLLTSCLSKDGTDRFNYLQMIALLMGNEIADKIQAEHRI